MLGYCWASVEDDGPTLNQHRISVLCLLGLLNQYTHRHINGLMLAQRHRRMANVETTLGHCLVFSGIIPQTTPTALFRCLGTCLVFADFSVNSQPIAM